MIGLREQTAMGDLSYGKAQNYAELEMGYFIHQCWSHGIWISEMFDIRTDRLTIEAKRGEERYVIRIHEWALRKQTLPEYLKKLREVLAHLFKIEEW